METLKHAAEQAKGGRGKIVAAMAEPGVGKSRLFFEFEATSQSGWMGLETFSVSHGKASAYLPVIDLLRNYFDISATDDERKRREKVAGRIAILDRALEDTLPYLFALLGIVEGDDPLAQMDGQIKKRRTLEAIKRILLRESLNQPLTVIFEDLHWIDEQTQELLNLLADSIGTAKILLLVNYRPEYSHQWNSKTYYTQLRLDPLGKASADEMLSSLLGASPAPATQSLGASRERPSVRSEAEEGPVRAQDSIEGLKRLIIERTEGNPFFMEETVQVLLDEGALVRNDTVHLTKPLAELKIPPTVQAILASRIDRLPPDEKELLQTLAVIGREFALSLVRRVYDGRKDNELERMLADLQTAEFIYEQPAAGDIEYIFKHALTQEVSYNALLFERRKQIHERTAEAIELLFAASMADHYERLAHHYGRSGNVRKAVSYLQLAAQQAMNRSAYAEASGQLDSALELLRTQPDDLDRDRTEIAIRFDRAICVNLSVKGAFAATAALDNLERARELSEKIGDDIGLLRLLAALAFIYSNRFEKEKARTVCEKLLRIATRTPDPERIGHAWCWLGFSSLWEGNFRAALEQFDRACQLPVGGSPKREVTFGNWRTLSRSLASQTLWLLGYPDRAAVMSRESVAIARGIVDSASDLVATLFWAAFFNLLKRDGSSAYRQADEAGNLARDNGLTALLATTAFGRAWALVQTGKIKEGLSEMVRWRTELLQTAAGTVAAAVFYLEVAEVYLAASRRREGLEAVADGLALMEGTGTGFGEAEMRRLKGELLLNSDSSAAAEAAQSFREAIEVARRQSAKSWELRATMSLARLLDKQGNRDEARAMLAEIYNWFTEGFDTTDLIDAKALLKELN
jgi:tetratricopeptide (TPR) repeat protein